MQIALTSEGDFLLTYPSGRSVEVPNSQHACEFLYRILYYGQGARKVENENSYPAQVVINQWAAAAKRQALLEDEDRLHAVAQETAHKYGIALSELDLTL